MPNTETLKKARAGDEAAQRAMYLDYVNNFLTVKGFANYYGLFDYAATNLLAAWREVHESHCAAVKAAANSQT